MEETYEAMDKGRLPGREEEVKAARKTFSRLGGVYVIGTIVIYAAQLVPTLLVRFLKPEWLTDANIVLTLSMLPMYLIGMPVLIMLVKRIPGQVPERHEMKAGHFIVAAIMCYAIVYITNILGNIITAVIGMLKGSAVPNVLLDATSSVNMWLMAVYMVICAPIMEEYVFRKLIVDKTVRYGQGVAVMVSGLMFGLFHGNLNQFVYAFVLGLFLAFLYVKTGNLKITIALHMMINFVGGIVSSWLMRMIDLTEYEELMQKMDWKGMTVYVQHNLTGILAYAAFSLFVFGMMIAGGILLIVCLAKKKFVCDKEKAVIPRGQKFRTVILNVGMLIYVLFWTVMIIAQLFM